MQNTYNVTGTLTDDRTVALDERLPLSPMRVCVVVEPLHGASRPSYQQDLSNIRARQSARGHKARSREEVDSCLRKDREGWRD